MWTVKRFKNQQEWAWFNYNQQTSRGQKILCDIRNLNWLHISWKYLSPVNSRNFHDKTSKKLRLINVLKMGNFFLPGSISGTMRWLQFWRFESVFLHDSYEENHARDLLTNSWHRNKSNTITRRSAIGVLAMLSISYFRYHTPGKTFCMTVK